MDDFLKSSYLVITFSIFNNGHEILLKLKSTLQVWREEEICLFSKFSKYLEVEQDIWESNGSQPCQLQTSLDIYNVL